MQRIFHTPEGVRDIYNGECSQKRKVQEKIHRVFHQYGYEDIETPTFEYFEVFRSRNHPIQRTLQILRPRRQHSGTQTRFHPVRIQSLRHLLLPGQRTSKLMLHRQHIHQQLQLSRPSQRNHTDGRRTNRR